MRVALSSHVTVPTGKSRIEAVKDYQQAWENSAYLLEPVYKMLKAKEKELMRIDDPDFDTPNHYAKLMFREGKLQEIRELIANLPESAK